jgi:protein YIPF5/7
MPPPPPSRKPVGDSTDAFFNDFNQSSGAVSTTTATTTVRQRGGPPLQPRPPGVGPPTQQTARAPVIAGRGLQSRNPVVPKQPRPPQPPPQQQQPQQQLRTQTVPYQQSVSNPVVPQQQSSNSYYNSSSFGAAQPPTLLSQQPPTTHVSQPKVAVEESSNDWYSPSAADTSAINNDYGMVQQQQQQQQQQYYQQGTHQMSGSAATPYPNSNYTNPSLYFDGPMDTSGRTNMMSSTTTYSTPQTFIPQPQQSSVVPQADLHDYYENEPPLLEELGVNWEHIMMKTKAVVIPFRRFQQHSALADPNMIVEEADLAGPLAYALLLGGELLVTGKLQFGYIYGFGLFGCLAMTLILNLMSPTSISFWTVTSILGYALIPVNILAALKIFLFSFGTLVQILAIFTVFWSTTASTRLLEIGFGLTDQRYLLAYPIALLYSAFVLITIF